MKKTVLNKPLRTGLWAALLMTFIGISACSSEKEVPNSESAEVMGVNQNNESEGTELTSENSAAVEGMPSEGTTPMTSSDADMVAGSDMATAPDMSTGDATGGSDMQGATEKVVNNEPDAVSTANPNADKTPAPGVQ